MVEKFTAFRASDGSTHDSEWLAYKRELYVWLRANGLDNEGYAQGVVRRVDEGRPGTLSALLEIVTGLIEHAPPPPPRVAADPEAVTADAAVIRLTEAAVIHLKEGEHFIPYPPECPLP